MTIVLRPYQHDAVAAAHAAHARGQRRPAVVVATGGGKSVIIAEVARTSRHGIAGGKRALILAHRKELVEQNAQEMRDVAPDLRVGIVKGTRNELQAHVISASTATLANPLRRAQLRDIGLVIYDECHHAPSRTSVEVLQHFGCMGVRGPRGDDAMALGFTATMMRGDKLALGDIWPEVVYVRDIADLIAPDPVSGKSYLVRPHGIRVQVDDLDLSRVRKVGGDWSAGGLGAAVEDSMAPKKIVEALREHAPDRQTILFAPLVHTAEVIRDALREGGFTAELVHGGTDDRERERVLQAYRDGRVQVLCNAMVFTEGTNLPMTSCIAIARPTENAGLFIQMIGRGLRLWPGKTDCVVLDMVDATGRHRLKLPIELFGEDTLCEQAEKSDLDEDEAEEQEALDHALGFDAPAYREGQLVSTVVDLFEGADAGWLRTYGGVWFLATAQRYVAVLPRVDGGYGVVSMHKARAGESRWVPGCDQVGELSFAMAHAQGEAEGLEREAVELRARSMLVRHAEQWGLRVDRGMTTGELRKMIVVGQGSARIDGNLPGWVRR